MQWPIYVKIQRIRSLNFCERLSTEMVCCLGKFLLRLSYLWTRWLVDKVEQIAADLRVDLRYSMDHLNHRASLQIPGISNADESRSYVRNTCFIYLREAKVNVDLTKWPATEAQREVEISSTLSSIPALDRGKWLTSLPGFFGPGNDPVSIV